MLYISCMLMGYEYKVQTCFKTYLHSLKKTGRNTLEISNTIKISYSTKTGMHV